MIVVALPRALLQAAWVLQGHVITAACAEGCGHGWIVKGLYLGRLVCAEPSHNNSLHKLLTLGNVIVVGLPRALFSGLLVCAGPCRQGGLCRGM